MTSTTEASKRIKGMIKMLERASKILDDREWERTIRKVRVKNG